MGSAMRRIPYGADASVRKRQDLERAQKEQAAARGLAASQIGSGGTLKVDGSLQVTGSITVPGTLSSAGAISAGTTVTAGTDVTAVGTVTGANVIGTNVFALSLSTNITATRVALWGRTSDGYIATASSSLYNKTILQAADLDERAKQILQITVGYFEYIDEVRKRDDPSFADYVGPEYHVGTNLGAIAEQLDELGLWEWVVYERQPIVEKRTLTHLEPREDEDGNLFEEEVTTDVDVIVGDELVLDENGKAIPYAIHDILIGWAALIVAQYQEKRLARLEAWAAAQGFEG